MFCVHKNVLVIFGSIFLGAAHGDQGSLQVNMKAHPQQVYQYNKVIGMDLFSPDIEMKSSQILGKTINVNYILRIHNKMGNDLEKHYTHKDLSAVVSPTFKGRVSGTVLDREDLEYFNQMNKYFMSMDYNRT